MGCVSCRPAALRRGRAGGRCAEAALEHADQPQQDNERDRDTDQPEQATLQHDEIPCAISVLTNASAFTWFRASPMLACDRGAALQRTRPSLAMKSRATRNMTDRRRRQSCVRPRKRAALGCPSDLLADEFVEDAARYLYFVSVRIFWRSEDMPLPSTTVGRTSAETPPSPSSSMSPCPP